MNMPPTAPAMPPMPTMEATARFGNMSDENVKMFADQAWCAEAATPMRMTASHMLLTIGASMMGSTHKAGTSIAVFRAAFSDQPREMSLAGSHPPAMLPTVAIW